MGLDDARAVEDDEPLWASQRSGQRSPSGTVVKVSALPTDLTRVIAAADSLGARLVSRASLGISYLSFEGEAPTTGQIRKRLNPLACTVLDRPVDIGREAWARADPEAARVMAALKSRLDPAGILPPIPIAGTA